MQFHDDKKADAEISKQIMKCCLTLREHGATADYDDVAHLLYVSGKKIRQAIRNIPSDLSAFVIERHPRNGSGKLKLTDNEKLNSHIAVLEQAGIVFLFRRTIAPEFVLSKTALFSAVQSSKALMIVSEILFDAIRIKVFVLGELVFEKNLESSSQNFLAWKTMVIEKKSFKELAKRIQLLQQVKLWQNKTPKDKETARTDFTSLVRPIHKVLKARLPFISGRDESSWIKIRTSETHVNFGGLISHKIDDENLSASGQSLGTKIASSERGENDDQNSQMGFGLANNSIQTEESREVQPVH